MTAPDVAAPVRVFVARDGNGFMRDIAAWIVEAATIGGRTATLVDDGDLPTVDGSINLVVAPHELFELAGAPRVDLQRAAAASICVCTEQPGTPWFHLTVDACRRGLLSLDINPHGVEALRAVGVRAERLALGAVPSMADVGADAGPGGERPTEILFLGGLDERRGRILADLAPALTRHRCDLRLFLFDRPVTEGTPGVVFGADKYRLLASSRVLINLHRDRAMHLPAGSAQQRYFEWARVIEAMANGCVVVTEPAEGFEPLVPGVHFVEAEESAVGETIESLLADPARLHSIAAAAHEAVMGPLALSVALAPLLDRIETDVLPHLADHVATSKPTKGLWRLGASQVPPPVRLGAFRPYRDLQRRAKEIALAEGRALRALDSAACVLRTGQAQQVTRTETAAYATARPDVSVVVSLYDYAGVVHETLDSIIASTGVAYEVIVVEDHSTDDSREVVGRYLAGHPEVPMVLLSKDANAGLAAARNSGFDEARAPLVMVIDADNHVYAHCLGRLAAALASDEGADMAYGILEDFGDHRGVRSALAWDVGRLCSANYIDAQAMVRRTAWERLGGYRDDDDHVFGWEDWDLWLRLADSGGRAVLVPEILGRYRVRSGSMIALTNLATDDALDALESRYPRLPWPASRA